MENKRKAIEWIDLVIASDDNYFIALRTAVISTLVFNQDLIFHFHILYRGENEELLNNLKEKVLQYSKESKVTVHNIDVSQFDHFRNVRGSSVNYARLMIPSLLDSSRAIYLDCDILVLGSIKDFWNTDLEGKYAAVVQDPVCTRLSQDYLLDGEAPDLPYFNSGVMLFNLDLWRRDNIQEKVVEMIVKYSERLLFYDQTALNACLAGQLIYLDECYNFTAVNFNLDNDDVIFMHYMSRYNKPWEVCRNNTQVAVWQEFYKKYVDDKAEQWRYYKSKLRYWRSIKDYFIAKNSLLYAINHLFLTLKSLFSNEESKKIINCRKKSYYSEKQRLQDSPAASAEKALAYIEKRIDQNHKQLKTR